MFIFGRLVRCWSEWRRQLESARRDRVSQLARDNTLMDAALSVRDEGGRSGDVRSLFHHVGKATHRTSAWKRRC